MSRVEIDINDFFQSVKEEQCNRENVGKKENIGSIDSINPQHYRQGNIQCIDAMRYVFGDEFVAIGCFWNVFKYMWRYENKNGEEDIEKAKWYMNEFKKILGENPEIVLSSISNTNQEKD